MADRLANYEPVQARIQRFWEDHPRGRIIPQIDAHDDKHVDASCKIWFDITDPVESAIGHATEVHDGSPVNRQGWMLENAETSAIGRALANAGYSPQSGTRPSTEDMHRVEARDRKTIAAHELAVVTSQMLHRIVPNTPEAAAFKEFAAGRKYSLPALAADPEWRAEVDQYLHDNVPVATE